MARSFQTHVLVGSASLKSPWMSNNWVLIANETEEVAKVQRLGRIHVTTVALPDGSRWVLEPHGMSTVRAVDEPDHEFARITRLSWWGRRWAIQGPGFGYELISAPLPRRWGFTVGGSVVAEMAGSFISYNRVRVDLMIGLPMVAVLLAWHVVARPWEAAAAPRGLVPAPHPPTSGRVEGL